MSRRLKLVALILFLGFACFVQSASAGHRHRGFSGGYYGTRGGYAAGFQSGFIFPVQRYNVGFWGSPAPPYVYSGAYGAATWASPTGTYAHPQYEPSPTMIIVGW